jgi:hypothetical protein
VYSWWHNSSRSLSPCICDMWLFSKFHLLQLLVSYVYYTKTPISLLLWRETLININDCSELTAHVFDCRTKVEPILPDIMWDFKFSQQRVWCSELSSGIYCRVKLLSTDVSEVNTASIIVMMEAVRTSETSVKNNFTRQYIPEANSELPGITRIH